MKKYILMAFIFIAQISFSQSISISNIRGSVSTIANKLKSDNLISEMYTISDNNGARWLYIEDRGFSGLKATEYANSVSFSKQILELIYKSVSYNLEYSLSYNDFINILLNKGFSGVRFKTMNNTFDIPL